MVRVIHFRLLESTWEPAFVAALREHYTGAAGPPPGKKLAWEITETGPDWIGERHRGWIGLGEPSFKLAPRRFLAGRTASEVAILRGARPLPRTVSCFVYRLTAPGEALASEILRMWEREAHRDWHCVYGWPPEHWESMCQPGATASPVVGACFRRAGWRPIGMTHDDGQDRAQARWRYARGSDLERRHAEARVLPGAAHAGAGVDGGPARAGEAVEGQVSLKNKPHHERKATPTAAQAGRRVSGAKARRATGLAGMTGGETIQSLPLCEACGQESREAGFRAKRVTCNCGKKVCPGCRLKRGPGNTTFECKGCEGRP